MIDQKYFFAESREIPQVLEPTTYFSFIDKAEEIRESKISSIEFLFDSIEIRKINNESSPDYFATLPSTILTLRIQKALVRMYLNIKSFDNLEGTWVKITTKKSSSTGISCQIDGVNLQSSSVEIDLITPINELSREETEKYNVLRRALDISRISRGLTSYNIDDLNDRLIQFHHLNIFNVGQGNLCAFANADNLPIAYFDMGGGFGANRFTYPNTLRLCRTTHTPVILSHWDIDHFETALRSNHSHSFQWFVPNQPLGLTHFILAYRLS